MEKRPKRLHDSEEPAPIDGIAKRGHFKEGDLPGTDTFDDGIEDGKLKPASNIGSGGAYMEEAGPHDLTRKGADLSGVRSARQDGLTILDVDAGEVDDVGDDAAAQWLRANDPTFPKKPKGEEGDGAQHP